MIVNPNAGRKDGLQIAETVSEQLRAAGFSTEMMISVAPGGTRELAEQVDPSEWDGVLAVGGDGTLFEVVNGLLATRDTIPVPVGQVPVGTGNSFLRDLHIETVEDAVARIVRGGVREVDLGHFSCDAGSFYFANLLGAGFVSNVAYRAGSYKWLGSLSYMIGVVIEVIGLKSTPVTMEIDGKTIERDCVFVEVCNSRFTGGSMMMAPGARIDDGLLDVVLLNKVPRRTVLKLLPSIFPGTHVDAEPVEVFRGASITIQSERPLALTPDGETFGSTPIAVAVHPGKLRMFA
jgi:YegS/Rv2252/BmrU family lipid kinase